MVKKWIIIYVSGWQISNQVRHCLKMHVEVQLWQQFEIIHLSNEMIASAKKW